MCNALKIPNPNIVLFTVMTSFLAWKGYSSGIASGIVVLFYSLYFFSTDHSFVSFTAINAEKIIVTMLGILTNIMFIGRLHDLFQKNLDKLNSMNESLSEDKKKLEIISRTDTLTGILNRYAFRKDFDDYLDENLSIVVIDVDKFKDFNDTYGHDMGDSVLKLVSREMINQFGSLSCYRWGGDEFLIIIRQSASDTVNRKLNLMQDKLKNSEIMSIKVNIGITCGFTYGKCQSSKDLRSMLDQADQNLYQSKSTQRGTITYSKYQAKV